MARLLSLMFLALFLCCSQPVRAQQNGFDLAGPRLSITVRRGEATLPLTAVPSLLPGDRLTARADLPADQSARYLLIIAFLRGATNPPPKAWFFRAETWERKRATLELAVPEGAEQALVFMAPEAGGGFDAVRDAVRGRPGIFVRAAQDLHQASLDRARLDAFVAAVARIGETAPERLARVAPVLAESLGVRLNAECLTRQRALQAACLMQDRGGQVLQAHRGTTLTETLTGAPVDLAYRVAATPEGGGGFYSPYIGLARDLARLFGAFRSAQYQYLPALAAGEGEALHLWLNAAPSFQNPRSVLVAPLPPIGSAVPPRWRSTAARPLCLAQPKLVLPLGDASLLYATGFARDLSLRITTADGSNIDLPVVPDIDGGGLRIAEGPAVTGMVREAVLRGRWGFDGFTGPRIAVQAEHGRWTPRPDGTVIVGRDSPLVLRGGAAACIAGMTLAIGEDRQVPAWGATAPDTVRVTLPLAKAQPGPLTLAIDGHGAGATEEIALTARAEASRLDRFTIAAGDAEGVLTGQRLDQVASIEVAGQRFVAGTLTRGEGGDRLTLTTGRPVAAVTGGDARVTLRDGRGGSVAVVLAAPRPAVTVLARAVTPAAPGSALPIRLPDGLVPADATLRFSLRVEGGTPPADTIELATDSDHARLTVASGAVQRIGADTLVAGIVPARLLGAAASGALRVRPVRDDAVGDWQPLARIVRLPAIDAVTCPATGDCTLSGRDLFLVAHVGEGPGVAVPAGFVGGSITVPRFDGTTLPIRLQDAPDAVVRVEVSPR